MGPSTMPAKMTARQAANAAWHSAPFGAAHSLVAARCPATVRMRFAMNGVNHQPLRIGGISGFPQQILSDALIQPPAESAIGVVPVPLVWGQAAPRGAGA